MFFLFLHPKYRTVNLNLSREETSCMKGYAILCIVLHNLLHLVGPLVKENEFYYNYNYRAYWMWDHLIKWHDNLLGDLFSFFGWYGVPVFIFLSGFGITKKYDCSRNKKEDNTWIEFLAYNFKKLWCLMTPVFVLYLILGTCLWEKSFTWAAILAQLTLTINVLCSPSFIAPGVYWYFGLTLQLYIVFRLFFFRKNGRMFFTNLIVLTLVSLALCWWLQPDDHQKIQPIYEYFSHNCVRWFLPFFMGIVCAQYGKDGKDSWWEIIFSLTCSLGLLIACSFSQRLWIFTPVFAIVFFIGFAKLSVKIRWTKSLGVWLGGLSAYLFAAHPLVRPFFNDLIVPKGQLLMTGSSWMLTMVYLIVVVLLAMFYRWFSVHYFVSFCEKIINRCFKGGNFKKNE